MAVKLAGIQCFLNYGKVSITNAQNLEEAVKVQYASAQLGQTLQF